MNGPTDRQIETLHSVAFFLAGFGSQTILLILGALVVGLLLLGVVAYDWSRRRWGLFFPLLLLATGGLLAFLGTQLYGAAGNILAIEINAPRVWVDTPYEPLSNAVKASVGSASGWGVIAITAGAMYALLASVALVRYVLAWRRERRGQTAAPAASAGSV